MIVKKVLALAFVLVAGQVSWAVPFAGFGDGGASLQGVFDNITTAPVAGVSSVDVVNDSLDDMHDSQWQIDASGGSIATVIIEIAAWADTNTLGVYDSANPANKVELFSGLQGAGDQAVLSIKVDGSVWVNLVDTGVDFAGNDFGYYLDAEAGNALWALPCPSACIWYSDTALNFDGLDHMLAYQGNDIDTLALPGLAPGMFSSNEYVFAWEDQVDNPASDLDYTDFVFLAESVRPVPEPATMGMLGAGLLGLAAISRRRKENA